jgi:hypothetical protein
MASKRCVRFLQYANQLDGGLGIPQRMADGMGIAQIGLDRMDFTDLAQRLQMKRRESAVDPRYVLTNPRTGPYQSLMPRWRNW